jgi:hypothetical protein
VPVAVPVVGPVDKVRLTEISFYGTDRPTTISERRASARPSAHGTSSEAGEVFKRIRMFVVAALALALGGFSAEAQEHGGVLKFAVPNFKPGLDPAKT